MVHQCRICGIFQCIIHILIIFKVITYMIADIIIDRTYFFIIISTQIESVQTGLHCTVKFLFLTVTCIPCDGKLPCHITNTIFFLIRSQYLTAGILPFQIVSLCWISRMFYCFRKDLVSGYGFIKRSLILIIYRNVRTSLLHAVSQNGTCIFQVCQILILGDLVLCRIFFCQIQLHKVFF